MSKMNMNLVEELRRIMNRLDERDARLIATIFEERSEALQMVFDLFEENNVLVGLLRQSGVAVKIVHLGVPPGYRTIH